MEHKDFIFLVPVHPFDYLNFLVSHAPKEPVIVNNMLRAWKVINDDRYQNVCCGISGGSDSDIALDICYKMDVWNKVTYYFIDPGLESIETKKHIRELESKYGITIHTYQAWQYGMTIPAACKKYGQPFLSKTVSEYIYRLQIHGFKWEDKPYDVLLQEYPKCKSALEWWCNRKKSDKNNIRNNKWLKEFLIAYPPTFPISNKCCGKSKKDIAHKLEQTFDLNITGIRRAEGGARSSAYKNCFSEKSDADLYRPIFWYKNSDKEAYCSHYGLQHSKCYASYGLSRTGCCGCPYSRNLEKELDALKTHEPMLYKAACSVFADSYAYTRKYREFYKNHNKKEEMISLYFLVN